MSERTNGVIFEAQEAQAVEFFCGLEPLTHLRLTRLDNDGLWGIYAQGGGHDNDALDEVARRASLSVGKALRYCYHSAVGYVSDLYENGNRTATEDDEQSELPLLPADLFDIFGRDRTMHDIVEGRFQWGHDDWALETDSRGRREPKSGP